MEAGPTPGSLHVGRWSSSKASKEAGSVPLQHRSCHLPPPLLPSSGKVWVLRRDSPWELCAGEVRVGTGQAFLLMVPAMRGRLLGLPRARGHPRGLHCAWTSGSERAEAGPLPHCWGAREAPPHPGRGSLCREQGLHEGFSKAEEAWGSMWSRVCVWGQSSQLVHQNASQTCLHQISKGGRGRPPPCPSDLSLRSQPLCPVEQLHSCTRCRFNPAPRQALWAGLLPGSLASGL